MKNIILFIVIVFFGCKKQEPNSFLILKQEKDSTEIKILKTDTLKLEKLAVINGIDAILITTLRKEIAKDSLATVFFRFDFFKKDTLIKSFPASIRFDSEEGEWYTDENVFSENKNDKTDKRFMELSHGHSACGYVQTHFLFFVDKDTVQLVTKNESISDSGYGIWTVLEPISKDNKLISFSSKRIQIDTDESKPHNDDNEDLVISYLDSIVYTQLSDKWIGKLKSQKEKIYRREFKKFDDYYKSEE
jgi:hypothetical protein